MTEAGGNISLAGRLMRVAPLCVALAGLLPVAAGLAVLIAAAFGWCPPLGSREISTDAFRALVAVPGIWRSAWLAGLTGFVTAGASFAISALLLAGFYQHRLFFLLRHAISPLLSLPHAALALGFAFLIAPSGLVFRVLAPVVGFAQPPDLLIVHDRAGISLISGLVLKEVSFLFLMMLAALPQTGADRLLPVAASLGYQRMATFFKVVMPAIYPQLRLPVVAVIAYAASAVDVSLILGPTTPAPLAVVVLTLTRDADLSRQAVASAAGVLQLGVTGLAVAAWFLCERVIAVLARGWLVNGARGAGEVSLRRLAQCVLVLSGMIFVLTGLGLGLWSVAQSWQFPAVLPESFSLRHWQEARLMAGGPLATSVLIGFIAAGVGLALALLRFEGETQGGRVPVALAVLAIYAPLAVPQVSLMRGMAMMFALLGLQSGLTAVILSHLVFVLPYVLLSLAGPWASFDVRYLAVARGLGLGAFGACWRVRLPMMRAAVVTAAAVGFAVSAGQYLPSLMAGGGRVATITTEGVALAAGSDRRIAAVYAVLQMLLPGLGFLAALLAMPQRRGSA